MATDDALGGLVNRRAMPMILLGLCGVMLLLSCVVGWYSVDASLHRWAYDQQNPDNNYIGEPLEPFVLKINLEMKLEPLGIDVHATPVQLQNIIENSAAGNPAYDNNAGRMGTVMLGVLIVQLVVLLSFAATLGFYMLQRRGKHDYANFVRRHFLVFLAILAAAILYFSASIGGAARGDEADILAAYPWDESAAYAPPEPEIGFWKTWTSDYQSQVVSTGGSHIEVWQMQVKSSPSSGWWLMLMSVGLALGSRVMMARNGDLDERLEPNPPPTPPKIVVG